MPPKFFNLSPRRFFSRITSVAAFAALLPISSFAALNASVTTNDGSAFYPGQERTLILTLTNNAANPLTNVGFSNSLPGTLPNGLKIVSSSLSPSCGAATLTAVPGTQQLTLANAEVPAQDEGVDGSCVVSVVVTSGTSNGAAASYGYTLADQAITGLELGVPVQNSGVVAQTFGVLAFQQPQIAKAFGNANLVLGGASTVLTVTVTNPNPVAISNVGFTDNFPQLGGSGIIKVANPANASSTCGATFNPAVGDTSITATGGALPASGNCVFTVDVEANQTNGTYTTGDLTNRIGRSTDFTNDLGIVARADATALIRASSPLRVAKAFSASSLSSGNNGSFTITLTNNSPAPLAITNFTDTPIDGLGGADGNKGLLVTSASNSCGSATLANTAVGISMTDGTIPANGSCTITVNFTGRVQTTGVPVTYTNSIPEGAVNVGNPAILSELASATILVADDLRVLKESSPTVVAPGNPIRYRITVQNFGAGAISNVSVADTFTQGQTYLTGVINGIDYTPSVTASCGNVSSSSPLGSSAPSFVIDTVPARSSINAPGSCTITMWAMTSASGNASTENVINPGGVCYDNGGSTVCNGGGSNPTTGTGNAAVLTAVKQFAESAPGVSTFAEGTIVRMTITLSNKSANPLTDVTLSDTLQLANSGGGQLRIATPANAASTCGAPTILAAPNATSISMNGATVPARANNGLGADGVCLLQVDVIGPAGVYPNTATVGGNEKLAGSVTPRSLTPLNTNTPILTYTSALTAAKSFNPASVATGGKSTVTVQLLNSSTLPLTNVSVKDPLPTDMLLATPPNAYTTCAGTPVITGAAGAASIEMTGASIQGGGNCSLLFDVVATGTTNWINSIPPGKISADGGVRNVTAVDATLTRNASTNLTILKSTNPSSLTFPGEVSQLTINVNNGTQAVTNMGVTDYFTVDGTEGAAANGWEITANPEASTTCPGGNVVAIPGSRSVGLSIATLAANANCAITVNVTSKVSGGVTNIIPANALKTDQGLTNGSPASTSLATSSNIGIVKKFTPNVVKPGERSRLNVTIVNPTSQAASDVSFTDILPANVTVPVNPNPTTSCGGVVTPSIVGGIHQVVLTGGALPATAGGITSSCEVEIDVLVASAGDFVNTIPVDGLSATIGGGTVKNSKPTTDTLRAKVPLTVNKAFSLLTLDAPAPAAAPPNAPSAFTTGIDRKAPGAVAVLTLRFENANATALTGLSVIDALPSGLVVAPTPAASTTCTGGTVTATASATSIRLSGGTLAANSVCTVSVNVLSNISGTYTNAIPAGAVTTNEGVENEAPTSARLIVSTPPTVTKQFSPIVIPPNGISRLTIFLTNDNSSLMTLTANLNDVLPVAPGQISVAATPNVATTCGGGVGAVVAAAGATTVRLNSGATIPANVGCTIEVDVTGVTVGSYINNIPAGALQTDLGNNPLPANAPLSINTRGYISGKVFKDNNLTPNGTFESGIDAPIVSTNVELRSGPTCSGALLATATTDTLGNYVFTDLAAASYSVCQAVQPVGTVNGTTTAGSIIGVAGSTGTPGVASNPTATTSQIANVVLNANGGGDISGSINNNFAEIASSSISGKVFKDKNTPNGTYEIGVDEVLAGIRINLRNALNAIVATTLTDVDGNYSFDNLLPGTYSVEEPTQPAGTANGITTAGAVGNGGTPGTATTQAVTPSRINNIVLPPNTSSSDNNFAEEARGGATGVVYDAVTRQPVAGATVTISGPAGFDPSTQTVNGSASSVTGADGLYQFLLNSEAPNGTYTLAITTYPAGYVTQPSTMLPVCNNTVLVTPTPDPAEVQVGTTAPSTSVPQQNPATCAATSSGLNTIGAGTTAYYFTFNFSNTSGPTKSASVSNNHIPLDPILGGAIVVTKSTPLVNVVRGDLVPYTITATNTLNAKLTNINVVDTIPAGFRYRTGSASLDGARLEPQVSGRNLTWPNQTFEVGDRKTWRMLLVVGTGVSEGEYVNRVAALNNIANTQVSNTATATVRVVPDPTFDCSDIIGKVFDDKNANGYQDQGELGIANVRVATARGLLVTSDQDGRFHVACAAISNADRGSNFVMKLDERTLPSGYRITTENPRDVRVTRGKMVKLNFGATVHRVIRLDISGAAFIADSTELQASYLSELQKLPEQLQTRPSVLRIAYRRGAESADLAKKRVDIVKDQIKNIWQEKRQKENEESEPLVPLMIETEMEAAQ